MTALRVDAGFLRKSIGTQLREALALLGDNIPPTIEDGSYVIGGRRFTPGELADRILDGGFAESFGRAKTIVAPAALYARNLLAACGLCQVCAHADATVVTVRETAGFGSGAASAACGKCGEARAAAGYRVVPIEAS